MTRLKTLSFHFISLPPRSNFVSLPPQSGERVVLPSLTSFKYRGTSKYLDSFVARIYAPRLDYFDAGYVFQPTMDVSQLGQSPFPSKELVHGLRCTSRARSRTGSYPR
jgi:hypothetical protein